MPESTKELGGRESDVGCALVFVFVFLALLIFVTDRVNHSEIRDLQRRIAVLEQQKNVR